MTEGPVIDPAAIERLKEWGGEALAQKMIEIFLLHSPDRLAQVREGLAGGTPRTAELGAHSLKSSAANVGAVRLQALAARAEALSEDENLHGLGALLPELEEAFEAARETLSILAKRMAE